MPEQKPLTPQKVSAILKKAGFERNESSTTGVRGRHDHSEGYKVQKSYAATGRVLVSYYPLPYRRGDLEEQRKAEMLAAYEAALTASGLKVQRLTPGNWIEVTR